MKNMIFPGTRWSKNPPKMARKQPPTAIGVNHAINCNAFAPMMLRILDQVSNASLETQKWIKTYYKVA